MTCILKKYGLPFNLKIKVKTMKTIILVLFAVLVFAGCDNSVGTDGRSNKDKFSDSASIGIYQNYGKCDTVCVGLSVVLLSETVNSGEGYSFKYTTGSDSLWDGERWLLNSGIFLSYVTTGEYIFTLETAGGSLPISGQGLEQLNVNCNTTYNLTIQ